MPTTKDSIDSTRSSVHMDAIRGGAALIVLLGHTRDLFFSSLNQAKDSPAQTSQVKEISAGTPIAVEPRITTGNEAVMIFFVLSGYLVGGSAIKAVRRNTWSWKNYLTKRMTRLWIVLIPALLLGVLVDYTGLHLFPSPAAIYAAPPQQQLVSSGVIDRLTAPVVAANVFFLQGIRVRPAGTNDSLWSLANEFWYYLAFPALLLVLERNQPIGRRCIYLLIAAAILFFIGRDISQLFVIWMAGAMVSLIPLRLPGSIARILAGTMAVFLPILFVVIRRAPLSLVEAEWTIALYFAALLYVILHQTEKARNGIYQSLSGFFSRISYTLYLVHLPIAVFLCACINNPWHRWAKSPKNLAAFLALNMVLVLFSYLFYLAFEANTDKVRVALFHRSMQEKHLPSTSDLS